MKYSLSYHKSLILGLWVIDVLYIQKFRWTMQLKNYAS